MNIALLPSTPFKWTGEKERKGRGEKNPRQYPAEGQNNEKVMNHGAVLYITERALLAPGAAGEVCVC